MVPLRKLITRTTLLVAVTALAAGWPGGRAAVGATEPGQVPGWVTMPGGSPLFYLDGIAPGDRGSATLTVTNPQPFPVKFTMSVISLDNDDNGCNEPEQAIGDTTCGAGGGELQLDLRLNLASVTGGLADSQIAEGTVAEWAVRPAVDPVALAGDESRTYRVGYDLPVGSSNLTQSDRVAFVFEMRLDQAAGPDVASDPPVAIIPATSLLPQSGIDVRAMVMAAMSASVVGLGLYRLSTHRRRAT
jgi:hypothetical protein